MHYVRATKTLRLSLLLIYLVITLGKKNKKNKQGEICVSFYRYLKFKFAAIPCKDDMFQVHVIIKRNPLFSISIVANVRFETFQLYAWNSEWTSYLSVSLLFQAMVTGQADQWRVARTSNTIRNICSR